MIHLFSFPNKEAEEAYWKLFWAQTGEEPCETGDPDLWVGNWVESTSPEVAAELCADCKVKDMCLDYALKANEKAFIYGGKTATERAELLRARRQPSKKTDRRPTNNKEQT